MVAHTRAPAEHSARGPDGGQDDAPPMAVDQWDTLPAYSCTTLPRLLFIIDAGVKGRDEKEWRREEEETLGEEGGEKGLQSAPRTTHTTTPRLALSRRIKEPWNARSKKHAETGDSSCRGHNSAALFRRRHFPFFFSPRLLSTAAPCPFPPRSVLSLGTRRVHAAANRQRDQHWRSWFEIEPRCTVGG